MDAIALDRLDLIKMQAKQEPVILGHMATQRGLQLVGSCFQLALELREAIWSGLAGDNRVENRATGLAQDVADHAGQLDVGVLEYLLNPKGLLGQRARHLLACAGQLPQLLGPFRRDEAAADQPVREEFRQPLGVAHV
jgi:hypothetical protein